MKFLTQTLSQFSQHRCTTLAAALAYYTAFALPPLLYLLMTVLTFALSMMYDGDRAKARAERLLESQAAAMIGNPAATAEIATILENSEKEQGKWWKTLLSFAGIVLGATGVVTALQTALNQVWQVKPDPETSGIFDMLGKRVLSFAMILGLGFLLLVSLVVSSVLSGFSEFIGVSGKASEITNFAVQAAVVFVMFSAIFKIMPDAQIRWRDVMVGAAITTILFLVGRFAMQIYFSMSEPGAQLGAAAASLAVLLVWVYYTAMIVLLGAEATQVYAAQYGEGIQPESGAVRVVEEIQKAADKPGSTS